jgi:hypothetical protein
MAKGKTVRNMMTTSGAIAVSPRRKIVRNRRSNNTTRDVVVVMTETMVDVMMIIDTTKVGERIEEIDATTTGEAVRIEWRKTARVEVTDIATAVTMMMKTVGMMQGTEKTGIGMESGVTRTDEKMTGTWIESGTSIKSTTETAISGTINTIRTTVETEIVEIGSDATAVLAAVVEDDRGLFKA